jgi:type II secretory pathway component PulK
VYPRDTNAPKINLNTADPVVIQASLASEKGAPPDAATQVDRVVAARPLSKLSDVDTVSGLDALVKVALKSRQDYVLTSDVFSVYAEGEANGVKRGVLAIVDRTGGSSVLRYWRLAD